MWNVAFDLLIIDIVYDTRLGMAYKQNYYRHTRQDSEYLSARKEAVRATVKLILEICKERNMSIKKLKVLDVGAGKGEYSKEMARYVNRVVSVEPDKALFQENKKLNSKNKKIILKNCLIEEFKSKEKFDLVLSLTTFEHMPNQESSYRNIFRLMKKGGLMYLTAPNKLWPFDTHYKLFFATYLPLPLANLYVKISGRGPSFEDSAYSKTYVGMKRFFDRFNCFYEFYLPNPNSKFLGMDEKNNVSRLIANCGIRLISVNKVFWNISKGFIVLITKK